MRYFKNGNNPRRICPAPLPRNFQPQRGFQHGFDTIIHPFPRSVYQKITACPWLPNGGAGRPNGLTEGVWFVEWEQVKNTNDTPFAALQHFPQRGQREKAPLKGELPPQRLRGCSRQSRFCKIPGEFVQRPLGFPRGEAGAPQRGVTEEGWRAPKVL